jgi:hypothetical protein
MCFFGKNLATFCVILSGSIGHKHSSSSDPPIFVSGAFKKSVHKLSKKLSRSWPDSSSLDGTRSHKNGYETDLIKTGFAPSTDDSSVLSGGKFVLTSSDTRCAETCGPDGWALKMKKDSKKSDQNHADQTITRLAYMDKNTIDLKDPIFHL